MSRASFPDTAPAFVSRQVVAARRFYLNLKPRRERGLAVACGGFERCAPDYLIDRNSFPYLSLEFVVGGQGQVSLAGKTHDLIPGMVFTYGPATPHVIRTSGTIPLAKYFVDFVGLAAERLMAAIGLPPGEARQVTAIGDVRGGLDTLIALGLRHDQHTERTCALQLELLLHTIARSCDATSVTERRSRMTFERCREYIDNNYLTVASAAEVAMACQVDNSHLCRLFRRFHNEAPFQYLQRLRMQWAADRLHSSGALVREVADELRIDPYQFSRAFKRVHGLSPTAFLATRSTISAAKQG